MKKALNLSIIKRFYACTAGLDPWSIDVWFGIECDNDEIEILQAVKREDCIQEFTSSCSSF